MISDPFAKVIYTMTGELIAQERRRRTPTLTQQKLADRTRGKLTRSAIANIESGRQRVSLHHLYELSLALQVDPNKLLPPLSLIAQALPDDESPFLSDPDARAFTQKVLAAEHAKSRTGAPEPK